MLPQWSDSGQPLEDARVFDEVFSLAYEELRQIASSVRRREINSTLSSTALVHEAWLRLAKSPSLVCTSELHFKRIAARAMRHILVEAARRRNARKRGGGNGYELPEWFELSVDPFTRSDAEMLALDSALDQLARLCPRQAAIVEHRFFTGMSVEESATLLNVGRTTAERDWRAARAWLAKEIRGHAVLASHPVPVV